MQHQTQIAIVMQNILQQQFFTHQLITRLRVANVRCGDLYGLKLLSLPQLQPVHHFLQIHTQNKHAKIFSSKRTLPSCSDKGSQNQDTNIVFSSIAAA